MEVVQAYFDAWSAKDESMPRDTLAPDVSFVGALGKAEACVKGLVPGTLERAFGGGNGAGRRDGGDFLDV
ncbi:hypothetical protein [Corallococcus sp. AB045]|uniref:hypothetical protein n=1 Tax=Corallococcus sp. AB045 TaxID=2316719 RepID=UPI0018F4BFC0|nr:hypothetical protein [Corallococcus sp. AB045]